MTIERLREMVEEILRDSRCRGSGGPGECFDEWIESQCDRCAAVTALRGWIDDLQEESAE